MVVAPRSCLPGEENVAGLVDLRLMRMYGSKVASKLGHYLLCIDHRETNRVGWLRTWIQIHRRRRFCQGSGANIAPQEQQPEIFTVAVQPSRIFITPTVPASSYRQSS